MTRTIEQILTEAEVIAIIGCSADPYRTSHHIAKYLKKQGFTIIPINPQYEEVLGEKCYNSIIDLPDEIQVDITDIFRNSRYTADMVDTVIERMKKTGQKPVVWTQLGVSSTEARAKAEAAELEYIEERCLMVDHRNLVGSDAN